MCACFGTPKSILHSSFLFFFFFFSLFSFLVWTSPLRQEVGHPPNDSISSLSWSPTAPFLAGTSWNQEVRIWEVAQNGDSRPHLLYKHAAPVLDCVWSHTGDQVFSAGCDNKVMCQDLRANKLFQVAQHDKPIRRVKWIKEFPGLVTGGWDNRVSFWDPRQPK